jgi:hypothetical protein
MDEVNIDDAFSTAMYNVKVIEAFYNPEDEMLSLQVCRKKEGKQRHFLPKGVTQLDMSVELALLLADPASHKVLQEIAGKALRKLVEHGLVDPKP